MFTSTEESDIPHASGGYPADHRYATITALTWLGDVDPDVDHGIRTNSRGLPGTTFPDLD